MQKIIIDFGKYKGVDIDEVPASYLMWMWEQKTFETTKPMIWQYIKKHYNDIEKEYNEELKQTESVSEIDIY